MPDGSGGLVIYSAEVAYLEPVVPLLWAMEVGADLPSIIEESDVQLVATWSQSLLGSVGLLNLSGTFLGEFCAEQFELAWRRANN